MDSHVGLTKEKEQALVLTVGQILSDINRCIHKWNRTLPGHFKPISYTEVRGLVHNWIARHLRTMLGERIVHGLFRNGKPIVNMDPETGYISKITLTTLTGFDYSEGVYLRLKDILDKIDYKQFYYKPELSDIQDLVRWNPLMQANKVPEDTLKPEFSSKFDFNINSLSKFTF